jgi:hypothetical protein
MGMAIPNPKAGAQKPNIAGKGPGIPQQVQKKPAMNVPQNLPQPVATQNPAMSSNAPAPGGKAAGANQFSPAMQSMASTLMGNQQAPQQPVQQAAPLQFYQQLMQQGSQALQQNQQMPQQPVQQPPDALKLYQNMVSGGNPAQQQFVPQTQEMLQQQMPQNPAQQQIPQGQIDYLKQMLGVQNQPNSQGTLVGTGPDDRPIYSNDPNATPYTGKAMGGQYINGAFQPYQSGGPSPIFNNPYLQGRPQMPGMGKGAMGKGMPAQGGKGLPAPGGKGYGRQQLPPGMQNNLNQPIRPLQTQQMTNMGGISNLGMLTRGMFKQ